MGGSMGSVVGEKVTRAAEPALAARIPLVIVSASGGARMQEGTLALMQLAKTCAALDRLDAAGVPFISVMTDPTTGGVFASFAALGDVNVAEPNALIGFAGSRVSAGTIAESLPPGFQRSEFLFNHGFVDRVVPRHQLRDELARSCATCGGSPCSSAPFPPGSPVRVAGDGHEPAFRPFGFLNTKLPNLPVLDAGRRGAAAIGAHAAEVMGGHPAGGPSGVAPSGSGGEGNGVGPRGSGGTGPAGGAGNGTHAGGQRRGKGRSRRERRRRWDRVRGGDGPGRSGVSAAAGRRGAGTGGWERVRLARNISRPHALELLHAMATDVIELHGDRYFGDDPAIVAGFARLAGRRDHVRGPAEGQRHRGEHPPQLRQRPPRGLPQGDAAVPPGREVAPAGRHPRRHRGAPIPAPRPRSAASPRPSPARS